MSPFVPFGFSHLTAGALSLIVPAVFVAAARAYPAADRPIRYGFTFILLGVWIWWYVLAARRGWLTLGDMLPMNLCDWATIATLVTSYGRTSAVTSWRISGRLAARCRG